MFVEGYALNCTVASPLMPKRITNAKIALLDINLQRAKMPMGVSITITDPKKIDEIRAK